MAQRTKAEIVAEARAIADKVGIVVKAGDNAGDAGASEVQSLNPVDAMLRMNLLMIELLAGELS